MLTQSQINELKEMLLDRKREYQNQLSGEENNTENNQRAEGIGEISNIDNHPGDEATELFEREKDTALNNLSREKLDQIENALQAMDEGTYGICEVGGEEIPFERLQAVPETRRCVKHAEDEAISNGRAVEEDVLQSSVHTKNRREEVIFDREDSWDTVSEYGSSQTPSDVPESMKEYGTEGDTREHPGKSDEVEDKPVADLEGKDTGLTSERKEHNDGSRNRYEDS